VCFMRICDYKFAVYGFFAEHRCHKSSEHRRNYERCNSHPFKHFEIFREAQVKSALP